MDTKPEKENFKSNWLTLGVSAFSVVLGFLIGASNTPVLGAALGSVFAILLALLGLIKKEKGQSFKIRLENIDYVGKLLFIFSFLLFLGVITGENYRNGKIIGEKESVIPWTNNPPSNTYEALDWIVLAKKMEILGYSSNQIQEIYKIRSAEVSRIQEGFMNRLGITADSISLSQLSALQKLIYDKGYPFMDILPMELFTVEKKVSIRGPASIR